MKKPGRRHHLVLTRAKGRGRRAQPGHDAPHPGLEVRERFTPTAHVSAFDLAELGQGLLQRFGGEFSQWAKQDSLSAAAAGILAVLALFTGLRRGPNGAGVQMPVSSADNRVTADWARLLGCSERSVQYAFAELLERGFIARFDRDVVLEHEWHHKTAGGDLRPHLAAQVWSVTYLTKKGAVRIARRGETRRLVLKDGQQARVLVAAGAVGKLLAEFAQKIRGIAKRITDAVFLCTPPLRGSTSRLLNRSNDAAAGGADVSRPATGPPSRSSSSTSPETSGGGREGKERFSPELEQLWRRRALTAAQAWPELYFSGDDATRRWLEREFAPHRAELTRRFVAAAGPADMLEQQRRVDVDRLRLEQLERVQPTQRQRAIAKYNAKVAAFRRGVERLARGTKRN